MAKFCYNCGKELEDGSSFCTECGTKQDDKPTYSNGNTNNTASNTYSGATGDKSKVAAGLLGIFLGGIGVHNFYLGYTGKGVAQLLISILSCGILSPISTIWGFIEGILILTGSINTDANGYLLKD